MDKALILNALHTQRKEIYMLQQYEIRGLGLGSRKALRLTIHIENVCTDSVPKFEML